MRAGSAIGDKEHPPIEDSGATAGKPLTFETKQQEHGSRKKAVREKQLQMACIVDGTVEVGAVAVWLDVGRCRSQCISEYRYGSV